MGFLGVHLSLISLYEVPQMINNNNSYVPLSLIIGQFTVTLTLSTYTIGSAERKLSMSCVGDQREKTKCGPPLTSS